MRLASPTYRRRSAPGSGGASSMGTRQARANPAQAIRARREGRRPLATWCSVAKYPTAASARRPKNGTVPSSGRITPNERSARPMMAPPAQIRWLARIGFVSSSRAVVIVSFRARSPRREQRGGAGRSRGFRAQLGGKPAQVRGHVDVVPGFGESHRQSERARVPEQRIASVDRAERRRVEEARVHRRRADEIVAAILGRSHHHLVRLEKLEGRLEDRKRQMRTVAVDRDDAAEVRDEMYEGRNERGGQPVTALPDDVNARWQTGLDVGHVIGGAHHRYV